MKRRCGFILYSLVMAVIAIFFCTPILLCIVHSLKTNTDIIGNPPGVPFSLTFSHFGEVWRAMHFPGPLLRTLLIASTGAAGIVLIASMAAYGLQRTGPKVSRFLYPFFIFSLLIPFPSIMFPLIRLAGDLGLNNTLGIIPIYWGLGCPLAIFIFHSFIKRIPSDWEEAAALEGAGFFRTFFLIVFPLLKPAVVTVIILSVFRIWNDFLLPLILLPPRGTLQLAQFGFFIQATGTWGPASASLVLTSLPIVIFFIVIQKHVVKNIVAGVMKGG